MRGNYRSLEPFDWWIKGTPKWSGKLYNNAGWAGWRMHHSYKVAPAGFDPQARHLMVITEPKVKNARVDNIE